MCQPPKTRRIFINKIRKASAPVEEERISKLSRVWKELLLMMKIVVKLEGLRRGRRTRTIW